MCLSLISNLQEMRLQNIFNNLHLFSVLWLCSCTEKNLNEDSCLNSVVTAPHGKYTKNFSPHRFAHVVKEQI